MLENIKFYHFKMQNGQLYLIVELNIVKIDEHIFLQCGCLWGTINCFPREIPGGISLVYKIWFLYRY